VTTVPSSGSDGTDQLTPGTSCKQLLDDGHSVGDGVYWIDPDGGAHGNAFRALCDMTTDGGGWTLAENFVYSGAPGGVPGWCGAAAAGSDFSSLSNSFKLPDATINQLVTYGYRGHGSASQCYATPCDVDITLYWKADCTFSSTSRSAACDAAYRDSTFTTPSCGGTNSDNHWGLNSFSLGTSKEMTGP